jgi:cob(I)alamin adenosyltransferase
MVQLTRIYTKGGDTGKTSLGSGKRVKKSSFIIHAIGEVDETNSYLGIIRNYCKDIEIDQLLSQVQNDLFDLGADLCMPLDKKDVLRIIESQVDWLESKIDLYNAELPDLKSFVLPGGNDVASHAYVARAICRRAERAAVAAQEEEAISPLVVKYLNRLSDLLFVLGRYINDKGKTDVLWQPGASQK